MKLSKEEIYDSFKNGMKERKAFQDLPHDENPHHLLIGKQVYYYLREKFPNNTNEDLHSILNILCSSLICLMKINVPKDDHKNFLQLIYQILNKNI